MPPNRKKLTRFIDLGLGVFGAIALVGVFIRRFSSTPYLGDWSGFSVLVVGAVGFIVFAVAKKLWAVPLDGPEVAGRSTESLDR
jgi:hypothetical protein